MEQVVAENQTRKTAQSIKFVASISQLVSTVIAVGAVAKIILSVLALSLGGVVAGGLILWASFNIAQIARNVNRMSDDLNRYVCRNSNGQLLFYPADVKAELTNGTIGGVTWLTNNLIDAFVGLIN